MCPTTLLIYKGGKAKRIPHLALALLHLQTSNVIICRPFKVINAAFHVALKAGIRPSRDPRKPDQA